MFTDKKQNTTTKITQLKLQRKNNLQTTSR